MLCIGCFRKLQGCLGQHTWYYKLIYHNTGWYPLFIGGAWYWWNQEGQMCQQGYLDGTWYPILGQNMHGVHVVLWERWGAETC